MPRPYIPVEDRRLVRERAQGRCEYCQALALFTTEPFAVEHIIPLVRGGASHPDNYAYACSGCNGHKHDKIYGIDPLDGKQVPLFPPRQQRWLDHFGWREDYLYVVGLTPIGRVTVDTLQQQKALAEAFATILAPGNKTAELSLPGMQISKDVL